MLKILGFILLAACGALGGNYKSEQLKKRVDFFEKYTAFIIFIKVSVSFSASVLEEILSSVTIPYFDVYAHRVKNSMLEGMSLDSAWKDALAVFEEYQFLSEADISSVADFGKGLGDSDLSGQASHCELALAKAEYLLNDSRKEYNGKSRLYRVLGAALGAGIGLIMI